MTTIQPAIDKQDRDQVVQCVGEAYDVLDLMPGVDPNGPVLVWLAEQFLQLTCDAANADRGEDG